MLVRWVFSSSRLCGTRLQYFGRPQIWNANEVDTGSHRFTVCYYYIIFYFIFPVWGFRFSLCPITLYCLFKYLLYASMEHKLILFWFPKALVWVLLVNILCICLFAGVLIRELFKNKFYVFVFFVALSVIWMCLRFRFVASTFSIFRKRLSIYWTYYISFDVWSLVCVWFRNGALFIKQYLDGNVENFVSPLWSLFAFKRVQ